MVKNRKNGFSEIKFALSDSIKKSKVKFIIFLAVILTAFIAGIVVSLKLSNAGSITIFNFGVVNISGGVITSSFFSRLFSIILVMALLLACSFTVYTMPIALVIIGYRTYLLGLDISIMFICYGVSGALVSAIIAIPCQLAISVVLAFSYILLLNAQTEKKKYGKGCGLSWLQILLIAFIVLIAINLVETLLLIIFNASLILVI